MDKVDRFSEHGPAVGRRLTVPQPRAGLAVPAGDRGTIRARQLVPLVALPVADSLALVAAGVASPDGPSSALYALAVLAGLSAAGLHRLRICLRVSDQISRILAAVALPVLLLPADPARAGVRPGWRCCRPGWSSPSGWRPAPCCARRTGGAC